MTIQVGDKIPSTQVTVMGEKGPVTVSLSTEFKSKKIVLFAVPGAFTPTCSAQHLPGFIAHADDFAAKGVDGIVCLSVNDIFVMQAWGESQQADRIVMAADGSGSFTRDVGLEVDLSPFGLGERSSRYAMVVDDGVVTHLCVEPGSGLDKSSAETVLSLL